jgi:hypothetical protein
MNDALERDRLRLTDAERQAVELVAEAYSDKSADAYAHNEDDQHYSQIAATLRGLLERFSQFAKCESDRSKPIAIREPDSPEAIADARLAALQRLAELDEELGLPCTPHPPSTPAECSVSPECTSRPYWVDPPSGWRYGFPRLYDPAKDGDMVEWMIANGYPKRLADQGLACTFTEWTEDVGK